MEKRTLCCVQNGLSIEAYYGALKKIWDELQNDRLLMKESDDEKTHQFLMGLDDVYVSVRSNLLAQDPLPPLSRVYELLIEEERRQTMKKSSALTCSVYSRRRRRRHLPEDLLPDILCRLPVKSLLRFRCVSKSWCSLVDDDGDFARLHLKTFKNNCDETRLLVYESGIDYKCVVRSSDMYEPISEARCCSSPDTIPGYDCLPWSIVSSVDGLILLKSCRKCRKGGKFNSLKLWNPSIREFRHVPPLPVCADGLTDIEIGLGYDPLSKDYKLVELVFASPTVLHSVAIYTVGSGSWKMIPFKGNGSSSSWPNWHRHPWEFLPTSNVYLEGSLYFFAKDIKSWELVCFDLSKEVFSSITTPGEQYKLVLVDGRSSVAVLNVYSDDESVWVIERETMNWTKRCLFPFEFTQILYVKKNDDILTLRIRREAISDEKTGNKLWVTREEVVLYSPEKPEYKIWPLERASRYSWIKDVCGYVESLILHKRNMNV